ncbi:MAG: heat-shock protein Hsp70, partial [Planctomyces sp.]|nr:heat-shock protein Hsp70 [Planctomyces sp.]
MSSHHAVGIDLGTTYSTIAYLNEHGEPVTIPNRDGEMTTPSVVLFEKDKTIVGTEALRNSIRAPQLVVSAAKRFMGDPAKTWAVGGKTYTPVDISTIILESLLAQAREKIGEIEHAVITVPAQFTDLSRARTAEAGMRAGLKHVDIINEPVAAALCYVIGSEGMWFTELAEDQKILVVDLGGGTYDLSLVSYRKNEVRVIASAGDLNLGGLDFNQVLLNGISKQFQKEFGLDPKNDRESLQALSLEVEQTKRSLSVRPKAALNVAHKGFRKTYLVEQAQFEKLSAPLLKRIDAITQGLLKDNKLGWAHVDVVLTTGGASRMPMVQQLLKQMAGYKTLNSSLSPDLSIAHGATYFAGMLMSDQEFARSVLSTQAISKLSKFKQTDVNSRSLGILVRNEATGEREPNWLIPANTPLPASCLQTYGTVIANQGKVTLRLVESGNAGNSQFVPVGECEISPLPPGLPEGSEIDVRLEYGANARVKVSATV